MPLNVRLPQSSTTFKVLNLMVDIGSYFTYTWHCCLLCLSWNSLFSLSLWLDFLALFLVACCLQEPLPNLCIFLSSSTLVFLEVLAWVFFSSYSLHAISYFHCYLIVLKSTSQLWCFSPSSITTNLFAYRIFLFGEPYLKCCSFTTNPLLFLLSWLHENHDHSLGWPHNLSKPGQFWEWKGFTNNYSVTPSLTWNCLGPTRMHGLTAIDPSIKQHNWHSFLTLPSHFS